MTDIRFLNPITILPTIGPATGAVSIDITQKVTENYEHIITQNPIEDGSPTTDHITNLPPKISIQGGFTDTRITNLVGTTFAPQNAVKGLAKVNFDRLLELFENRETFLVMDGFHLFKDMQFKSLQLLKDREGFSIFFQAELWGIVKVSIDAFQKAITSRNDATNRLLVAPQLLLRVGSVAVNQSLSSLNILA